MIPVDIDQGYRTQGGSRKPLPSAPNDSPPPPEHPSAGAALPGLVATVDAAAAALLHLAAELRGGSPRPPPEGHAFGRARPSRDQLQRDRQADPLLLLARARLVLEEVVPFTDCFALATAIDVLLFCHGWTSGPGTPVTLSPTTDGQWRPPHG